MRKKRVKTFETTEAKYDVLAREYYLAKEGADEEDQHLDLSRLLKPKSRLFFSSLEFEVYGINNYWQDKPVENFCVYGGDYDDTANFLLELDRNYKHFSYGKKDRFDEPEIFDGYAYKLRPLNQAERRSFDALIKQKLDALYRK